MVPIELGNIHGRLCPTRHAANDDAATAAHGFEILGPGRRTNRVKRDINPATVRKVANNGAQLRMVGIIDALISAKLPRAHQLVIRGRGRKDPCSRQMSQLQAGQRHPAANAVNQDGLARAQRCPRHQHAPGRDIGQGKCSRFGHVQMRRFGEHIAGGNDYALGEGARSRHSDDAEGKAFTLFATAAELAGATA